MVGSLAVVCGLLLILIILVDAWETIVLPRRVTRRVRLSRQFIRLSWYAWAALGRRLPAAEDPEGASLRDRFLSIYGPLILLLLVAVWAVGLVCSFALVFWGLQPRLPAAVGSPTFGTLLYLSGETFFTLGYGDVAPLDTTGRIVAVVEVATGFTFLALLIGYLPVIYQGFSRRDRQMILSKIQLSNVSKAFTTLADWAALAFAAPHEPLWQMQQDGYQAALVPLPQLVPGPDWLRLQVLVQDKPLAVEVGQTLAHRRTRRCKADLV